MPTRSAGSRANKIGIGVSGLPGERGVTQTVDPLANDVSISAEMTDSSIKLSAKSRLVSGLDRLGGNLSELINVPMERRNAKLRGETQIIEAISAAAIDRIKSDPEVVDQLIAKQLHSAARRLTNHKAVLSEAIADLSARPPTDDEASAGPEVLDPEFLDRWERFAEDASTDELRAKWGKVLAAEVRKPGRISRRTMRALDELPPGLAVRFETICAFQFGGHLLKPLTGELSLTEQQAMVFYGLIADPGLTGHLLGFVARDYNGPIWLLGDGTKAVGLHGGNASLVRSGSRVLISNPHAEGPAIPVYVLTDVGKEIALIFEDRREFAWRMLMTMLAEEAASGGGFSVKEFRGQGGTLRFVAEHRTARAEKPDSAAG